MAATASPLAPAGRAANPDTGLKRDAIGYVSNLVIAVASVAPAGVLAMLVTRAPLPTAFWRRRPEQADPEVVV